MVALLVRLKLTLLKNSLKRSVWRTVGLIIGLLYALFLIAMAVVGIVALRLFTSPELAGSALVLVFAVITAGWMFFSLLVSGMDETVDPGRFALLPIRAAELQPGLLVAGLVGAPGAATMLIALAMIIGYTTSVTATIAAVIVVPLGVATCFLVARTATTLLARVLASRRFRDLAFVLLALLGAGFAIGGNLIGRLGATSGDRFPALLSSAAAVAGWTPFGWVWAVPAAVSRGDWLGAVIRLVLAVGFAVALWLVWRAVLAIRLEEPIEVAGDSRRVRTGGLAERLYPATAAGGVGFRTLLYWRRDPRYVAGVASFLILPLVLVATQLANPGDLSATFVVYAPVLLGLLISVSVAADLSYDGSAVWLHAASGLSGADDRAGRVYSGLTLLGPVLIIVSIVSLAISGQWQLAPQLFALVIGLTLIGFGVGSYVGVLWQWPAPPPGSSPFQKGSSGGLPALLSFGVSTGLSVLCALPLFALVIGSYFVGWLAFVALVVGIVGGLIVLRAGIRLGGRRLDRYWPEVLQSVSEKAG